MSKLFTFEKPNAIDILADYRWHWVPSVPTGDIKRDVPNLLWIHGTPTSRGHYPQSDTVAEERGYRAEYFTDDNGINYETLDIYMSRGTVQLLGRSIVTMVVHWPMPEFADPANQDSPLFIRALRDSELPSGPANRDAILRG